MILQETLNKALFLPTKRRAFLLLALIGIFIYLNALPNQLFWDDDDGILKNAFIKDWSYIGKYFSENLIAGAGFTSNYWRPMLLLMYSFEWHLWGDWAPGYHATNILLHVANALLLFLLLTKFFKRSLLSYAVALIFLVHPLQTEAITYVSGRGDPLAVLFMLLGMLAYFKSKEKKTKKETKRFFLLSQGAYIFALLSKDTAIMFPAFLVVMDFFLRAKAKDTKEPMWVFLKNGA